MLLIWDCQPRSDWTTRPRSLVSDTSSRSIPAIWRLGGLGGSRLKQTCMTLHFPGLSMRWLSLAQASRSCTSELIWLGLSAERVSTSVRSSTYLKLCVRDFSEALLITPMNVIGPNLVPWGTPHESVFHSERAAVTKSLNFIRHNMQICYIITFFPLKNKPNLYHVVINIHDYYPN